MDAVSGLGDALMRALMPVLAIFITRKIFKMAGLGKMGMGFLQAAAMKATRDPGMQKMSGEFGIMTNPLGAAANGALNNPLTRFGKKRLIDEPYGAYRKAVNKERGIKNMEKVNAAKDRASALRHQIGEELNPIARFNRKKAAEMAALNSADGQNYLDANQSATRAGLKIGENGADARAQLLESEKDRERRLAAMSPEERKKALEAETNAALVNGREALTGSVHAGPLTEQGKLNQVEDLRAVLGDSVDAGQVITNGVGLAPMLALNPGAAMPNGISEAAASWGGWALSDSTWAELGAIKTSVTASHGEAAGNSAMTIAFNAAMSQAGLYDANSGTYTNALEALGVDFNELVVDGAVQLDVLAGMKAAVAGSTSHDVQAQLMAAAQSVSVTIAADTQQERQNSLAQQAIVGQATVNVLTDIAVDRFDGELYKPATGAVQLSLDASNVARAIERAKSPEAAAVAQVNLSNFMDAIQQQVQGAIGELGQMYDQAAKLESNWSIEVGGELVENWNTAMNIQDNVEHAKDEMARNLESALESVKNATNQNLAAATAELARAMEAAGKSAFDSAQQAVQLHTSESQVNQAAAQKAMGSYLRQISDSAPRSVAELAAGRKALTP